MLVTVFCVVLIFTGIFPITAFADNAIVSSGTMYSYFQTFSSKGTWVDVSTPSHWITETGEVAYCLQTSKDSPYNSGYHTVEGSDYYSDYVLTGLYAILENGYPVTTGGFSNEEARYATANAIRFWCAENYCDGMPQYLNLKVNGDWICGKWGYEKSYIDPSIYRPDRSEIEDEVREQIDYELIVEQYPYDDPECILELICEVLSSNAESIKIGSENLPGGKVKERFRRLNQEHIAYVLDALRENTTQIKNIRAYLLTALYNAPLTIGHYFAAAVRHDFG